MLAVNLFIGYVLDVALGDRESFPHPVRWIGRLLAYGESVARRIIFNKRLGGALTVAIVVSLTTVFVYVTVRAAFAVHPFLSDAVSVVWIYFGLSSRNLADEANRVAKKLTAGDLPAARAAVGRIVSRDTSALDEHGVARAAIESAAENTVDGIISPIFYCAIGGAPLLWLFKAVSTADSMFGYLNERYRHFGAFAARLDDVMNYIPARLGYLIFPLAAFFCGASPASTLKTALRDHGHHASPNSGIPEAAMAGALKVRLGGPTSYEGEIEDRKPMGGEFQSPVAPDIRRAIRMMWAAGLAALVLAILALVVPLILRTL